MTKDKVTQASDIAALCYRLRAKIDSGHRAVGGGSVGYDSNGKSCFNTWGNEPIMVLANPDGPAAAELIEQLTSQTTPGVDAAVAASDLKQIAGDMRYSVANGMAWISHSEAEEFACRVERLAETFLAPSPASNDKPCSLADAPVGLFWHGDTLALKTEYGNNEGRIDAYIVSSGEFYWGDAPQTIANQRAGMVQPIDVDFAATALSATLQPAIDQAVADERERCARIAEAAATCGCMGKYGRCTIDDAPLSIAAEIRALRSSREGNGR